MAAIVMDWEMGISLYAAGLDGEEVLALDDSGLILQELNNIKDKKVVTAVFTIFKWHILFPFVQIQKRRTGFTTCHPFLFMYL